MEFDLERHAVRVLMVADERFTLFVHGHDPKDTARGTFYWTPGGGLDPGETLAKCAQREVREELGITLDPDDFALNAVVAERTATFPFDGKIVRQHERFLYVPVPHRFTPESTALSELEKRAILGYEWLDPAMMRANLGRVFPGQLADLVDLLVDDGRPDAPIVMPDQ